ncbi:MAG: RNA-binding S4 domain-containing protein [Pseudomonadales bacterium]
MTTIEPGPDARLVEIMKEPVELFKVLKFEGLVASGGAAKTAIAEGLVAVNGAIEKRKRRQIRAGDSIVFADTELSIRLAAEATADVALVVEAAADEK